MIISLNNKLPLPVFMDVAKTQLVNHVNLCVDYLLFTVLCLSLIVDFLTDGNVIPLLYLFALDGLNHEQIY